MVCHRLQSSSFVKLSVYNAIHLSMDHKHGILKGLRCIMQALSFENSKFRILKISASILIRAFSDV